MKGKVTPKTKIKRARTRLIAFLFSIMFAAYIWGCFKPPALIPEEFSGTYRTTHPRYAEEFFELSPGLITLGFGDGSRRYYSVIRVKKEIINNRMLYTILCGNEDEGEEFNFSFFTDSMGEGTIHFKNKPQVAWKKQETEISYNDNSDSQLRH